MRINIDEYYLEIAKAVSLRSTCLRRHYGAVIVNNDEIISAGYNGSPRGDLNCCDTNKCVREEMHIPHGERYELCCAVHAEQNAIISASRRDMIGGTIYIYGTDVKTGEVVNGKPCGICLKLLQNAGVDRIVFSDPEEGGWDSWVLRRM